MTTSPGIDFVAGEEPASSELLAWLAQRFPTRERPAATSRRTYFDTFDRRLARAGEVLSARRDDGRTRLELGRGPLALEIELEDSAQPGFAHELPLGRLRARLESVARVRRLLPLVEIEHQRRSLDVIDGEEKIVARVRLEELRAREPGSASAWRPLPPLLRVEPVRGYEATFEEVRGSLEQRGLGVAAEPFVDVAARAIGRAALVRAKPALAPELRADVGMKRIHRALLETALANEPGARADLDSEFLHDLRVAVRRARSLLGQVKLVFPDDVVARTREDLAWIGELTGATRDLDVFLLGLDELAARLPGRDLEHLRAFLRERQREEHALLVAGLDSLRFREHVARWRLFLEDEAPHEGTANAIAPTNAAEPLAKVLAQRVWRLYRRVRARCATLGPDSSADDLHALRIQCKKLRYVLDCLRELVPADEVEPPLASLRKLQEVLGRHQDAHVQTEGLERIGERLSIEGRGGASLLMTLGAMAERLRARARTARLEFAACADELCSPRSRERWRASFGRS